MSDTATLSETFITNGLHQIGCQGNIVKEGKQGEGVELCQIMQQILGRYDVKSEISRSNHHQYETQGIRKAGHSVSIAICKT